MRIYLQIPASEDNPPRYCQFILQEDLLGGWTLVKEAGRQDGGGRIKREYYVSRDEAERALMKARDVQVARGYQVVFVQGERPVQGR